MSSVTPPYSAIPTTSGRQPEQPAVTHLGRIGLAAAVLTAAATEGIRAGGVALGAVPSHYQPLQPGPIIVVSVAAALVATGVLAALTRWVRRPVRTFRIIAGAGLLLSLAGPLQAGAGKIQGAAASGATVITMLLMHIAAATIITGLLTTLGRTARTGA